MVAEEAMRLYPPAYSISRVAAADDVIDGHAIPKGSFINVSPWVTPMAAAHSFSHRRNFCAEIIWPLL